MRCGGVTTWLWLISWPSLTNFIRLVFVFKLGYTRLLTWRRCGSCLQRVIAYSLSNNFFLQVITDSNMTWLQRRIEFLNLPPNKANVEGLSWDFQDFMTIRDRVYTRVVSLTACFSTISLLSIIRCQEIALESSFRKKYLNNGLISTP